MKKHNFNAGPSILPREVIEDTAKAILDFNGSGLSLMEISHRGKEFIQVAEEVGYHDLDYFVNRFIQVKGCTPAKFRKQMQQ